MSNFTHVGKFVAGTNPKVKYTINNNGGSASGEVCESIRVFPHKRNNLLYHGNFCHDASQVGNVIRTLTRSFGPGTYRFEVRADAGGKFAESNEGNNMTSGTFAVFPKPKPDFSIRNFRAAESFKEGRNPKVRYDVVNSGVRATGQICESIRVFPYQRNNLLYHGNFCHDASQVGNVTRTLTRSFPAGTYRFEVRVDAGGKFAESNEGNNMTSGTFAVFKYRPDLAIMWPHASQRYTKRNSSNYFEFYIKNIGNKTYTGTSWATVRVVGKGDDRVLWYKLNTTLGAGQEKHFKINLGYLHYGGHTITVKADNNSAIPELNEYNNVSVTNVGVFN